MLNGLDLFSGIGGISLALRDCVRPVAYCEIDTYCQAVLLSKMGNRELHSAPIWDDIRTLKSTDFDGLKIDIMYGGFPCQDISVAGAGKGLAGERSGLFFEIMRLAKEIKPKFIFLENVPAITSRGGLRVVNEIASLGYDCRWCVISAASVGALHRRERWFLLAYSKHNGASSCETRRGVGERSLQRQKSTEQTQSFRQTERASSISADVANSGGEGLEREDLKQKEFAIFTRCDPFGIRNTNSKSSQQANKKTESESSERRTRRGHTRQYWPLESIEHWKETVSSMGKCSNGIPNHVDRLRALGNAVVPQQVEEAFQTLMGLK